MTIQHSITARHEKLMFLTLWPSTELVLSINHSYMDVVRKFRTTTVSKTGDISHWENRSSNIESTLSLGGSKPKLNYLRFFCQHWTFDGFQQRWHCITPNQFDGRSRIHQLCSRNLRGTVHLTLPLTNKLMYRPKNVFIDSIKEVAKDWC